jgi:hypothetical protein
MATHCVIGYETLDGGYRGAYCHWDGWPDHVGPVLEKMWHADVAILVERALTEDGLLNLNKDRPGASPILYRQDPTHSRSQPTQTRWPCYVYEWGYRKRLDGTVEIACEEDRTVTVTGTVPCNCTADVV